MDIYDIIESLPKKQKIKEMTEPSDSPDGFSNNNLVFHISSDEKNNSGNSDEKR